MSSTLAGTTLYPCPPAEASSAPIEHPLRVTKVLDEDGDVFTNTYPLWQPPPGRALFGGLLIGEAIQAAQQTVPPKFHIHHMNCTFHAPPDATKPIYYRVSRSSDGRSVATRQVRVEQNNALFFSAECNFSLTRPSNPVVHHVKSPHQLHAMMAPPPSGFSASNEKDLTEQMIQPGFLRFKGANTSREDVDPFIWHDCAPVKDTTASSPLNILYSWARTRGNMSDSPTSHLAVLGCLTDSWALSSFPLMNPAAAGPDGNKITFMISLNHTIWFHDPCVRLDDWLAVKKSSSWAAEGRCLIEQQIWDKQGKLVATCVQEGALRLTRPEPSISDAPNSKI